MLKSAVWEIRAEWESPIANRSPSSSDSCPQKEEPVRLPALIAFAGLTAISLLGLDGPPLSAAPGSPPKDAYSALAWIRFVDGEETYSDIPYLWLGKVDIHLRINQFPEWFVVEAGKRYAVRDLVKGAETTFAGKELEEGMPVKLSPGEELRLIVTPVGRGD